MKKAAPTKGIAPNPKLKPAEPKIAPVRIQRLTAGKGAKAATGKSKSWIGS